MRGMFRSRSSKSGVVDATTAIVSCPLEVSPTTSNPAPTSIPYTSSMTDGGAVSSWRRLVRKIDSSSAMTTRTIRSGMPLMCCSHSLHELVMLREQRKLHPVRGADLVEQMHDVPLHGVFTDPASAGDQFARFARD